MVDNNWVSKSGLVDVDSPVKSHHDIAGTQEAIKLLLANGTPNWVKWPEDYKAMVKEEFAAEKEISNSMAAQYKLEDQEIFENEGRKINVMATKALLDKLRGAGIKAFLNGNPINPKQAGLWCQPRNRTDKVRYVCFVQVPAMYEWSIVNLNAHGVADGEAYRGWRTVVMELIKKDILTEVEAHQIFGVPAYNKNSSVYYRSLWELRNGKKWEPPFTEL